MRDAGGDEGARDAVGLGGELRIAEPACLMNGNDGIPLGKAPGRPIEVVPDRLAEERHRAGAVGVAGQAH